MIQGAAPPGCLVFMGQWVRDALMFQPLLLLLGTGGTRVQRHAHPKGAPNTLLCFLVANTPIFQSFPISGSRQTGEWLWGTQCPLQRQHHTKKWVLPTFPTPPATLVPGAALPSCRADPAPHAVPMSWGLLFILWIPAGRAGSHRRYRSSP